MAASRHIRTHEVSAGANDAELSDAGRALLDDADAAAQRTTLGLAPIASSGSASDLSAGTVPTARLGSGTADATVYLRGDQTWAASAPGAHAPTHKSGGADPIRLDEFAAPTGTVNFAGQQAGSFRVENLTADPGSPTVGQIWLRTDL